MKRFVVFLVAVLTAASMLGAFPATAGPNHPVPFKGRYELTATSLTVLPNRDLLIGYVGTSNATHLGLSKFEATVVRHVSTTPVTSSVEAVFTAANGDQLSVSVEFTFNSTGNSVNGPFKITGGTGRFMNVVPTPTGGVAGQAVGEFTDPTHIGGSFEGTIQFALPR